MMSTITNTKRPIPMIRLIAWITILLAVLIGLALYWHHRTVYPSTDDAYVQANIVTLAPQVTGPISQIYVSNNDLVEANQKILSIDPKPFEIAVQSAEAQLDLATQKVNALQDAVKNAEALVQQRQSELSTAKKNADRILTLVRSGEETKMRGDQVRNDLAVAVAALKAANSQLAEAKANVGNIGKQNAEIRAAQAKLNQAKLDLQHTLITAPSAGQIVNFTARTGSMAEQSVVLLNIVNQDDFWVEANFKETQLLRIKPGQKATITVDTYPNHAFTGVVESISAGSGSAFSLFPPENATGNWVKVTQRIPVKVIIQNPDPKYPLRVGASAVVTIDTTTHEHS